MDFGQAVKSCFSKYATFSGRASRSEYWYFFLFTVIVYIVANILDAALFGGVAVLDLIATVVLLLPGISVGVRRLHDKDLSGWWYLLVFIPVIGWIVLLVWFCQRGTVGPNRFGPDPLSPAVDDAGLARI